MQPKSTVRRHSRDRKRISSSRPIPPKQYVKLIVRGMHDGLEFKYRINKKSKLRKVMIAHFNWQSLLSKPYFFYMYDNSRLTGKETPVKLKMEDGNVIEALPVQPLFFRKSQACLVREKLMKELECVNDFISNCEADRKRYGAESLSESSEDSTVLESSEDSTVSESSEDSRS